MRKAMVEADHPQLSIRAQCKLLAVNRNSLEPPPAPEWVPGPEHIQIMNLMRLIHAKDPTMGTRQLRRVLARNGYEATRWNASGGR